ncbi:MAG: photosystem I reaction center subunit PsaK [Cyanobacteria bacterium P01_A01_bin.84]
MSLLALSNQIATQPWTPRIAAIVSGSCVIALLVSFGLKNTKTGPKMPLLPVSIPAFIGAMCFGHILGLGIVLGLYNTGIL